MLEARQLLAFFHYPRPQTAVCTASSRQAKYRRFFRNRRNSGKKINSDCHDEPIRRVRSAIIVGFKTPIANSTKHAPTGLFNLSFVDQRLSLLRRPSAGYAPGADPERYRTE
jgi:hypothetical protein